MECRAKPSNDNLQFSTSCAILPSRMGEHGEHGKDGKHQPENLLFHIIREGLEGLERCWNGMMGFCAKC